MSLCPALGMQYAELRNGTCPWHLQHPSGKSLPISFVGIYPFITYNPFGGRDMKVLAALAKKFRFLPNLIPMQSWGSGTDGLGMTHHVSNSYFTLLTILFIQTSFNTRLLQKHLKWVLGNQDLSLVGEALWLTICHGCPYMSGPF